MYNRAYKLKGGTYIMYVNYGDVKKAIKPNTKLISIMAVNNEIGTSANDSEWLLNALILFVCAYPLQFLIYRIIIRYNESQNNHKFADDSHA